jgi:hypothetical protein
MEVTMKDWLVGLMAGAIGLALILSGVNIWLHQSNLGLQAQVNARQQVINDGVRLSQFNTQFVQALATMAAGTGDQAIANLLATHGITYTVKPAAGQAGAGESAGGSR